MGSEVLDQSEIDALLSAVETGDIKPQAEAGPSPSTSSSSSSKTKHVLPYDFKRPERVSKDQLRSIETMHEVFSRNLAASVSGMIRTIIDISLSNIDQMTYSEFIMSLPNPTCFNLISCEPLEGNLILEINHSVVFPIVDRLLGGGKTVSQPPERPLTDIEWKLVKTVTDKAVEQLKLCWADVKNINFAIAAYESNPQLVQSVAPNEPVVVISFEVNIGDYSGMMNLCIPFMVIEPVVPDLAIHGWAAKKAGPHASFVKEITDNISTATLDVSCVVVQPTITIKDLLELEPGDEILTSKQFNTPFMLYVEGKPKYWVKPGSLRGHKAVQIMGAAGPTDKV